jgi:hypothetical protein
VSPGVKRSVFNHSQVAPPGPYRRAATPMVTTPVLSTSSGLKAAGFRIQLDAPGDQVEAGVSEGC